MKKLILSLAAVAMTFGGFSAIAQDKKDGKAAKKAEQQEVKKDGKQECKEGFCPFEGLDLTDAQKEQLKQLRESNKAEQAAKKADKKAEQAAKKADKKAEQAAKKEAKRDAREQAQREQLAKVKAILTPEQYVAYLENLVVMKGQNNFRQGSMPQQMRRGERPGQQGQRPGQRPDRQQQRSKVAVDRQEQVSE